MRAVVGYESMYGNTRRVAEAIADGLRSSGSVTVVPVSRLERESLDAADLIVIGGPTHVHGMSRASTRKSAVEQAHKSAGGPVLEAGVTEDGPGLRDWFGSLGQISAEAAAFDTRLGAPVMFTGRASKGIARLLEQHGLTLIAEAESFLVTTDNELRPGEADRAREWGGQLAAKAALAAGTTPR